MLIEREIGHAKALERLGDRRPRLDRVHEMDLGARAAARARALTSASEAQSKWRTPPAHSARNTRGSGLHLTA